MDFTHQRRLTIAFCAVLAPVLGWQIANGNFLLGGSVAALLAVWLASRASGVPADALVTGLVLIGYLVGNRGFAQLHVPNVPLLPGEAALGLGLLVTAWRSARQQTLPVFRDSLNFAILVWMLIGVIRLRFDLSAYRFLAVRDFALVYYAGFFFLAQSWADIEPARRWIARSLTIGFSLTAPALLAFTWWPEFFLRYTTVGGIPLIFVKSDVAGGFSVAAVIWFVDRYVRTEQRRWLAFAATSLVAVALSNNRAAIVSLLVVCLGLMAIRSWRRLRPILMIGTIGLLALGSVSALRADRWHQSLLYRLYETAASVTDVAGERDYAAASLSDKPDNNQFRLVWWHSVWNETLETNPWGGLGFGHDLSRQFTETYYGPVGEDSPARSPHNFLLTVFGRMGLAGFAPFLVAIAAASWRALHLRAENPALPYWLGACAIFVSACFGVVLEGPMGAVVFWTLLGLANGSAVAIPTPAVAESPAAPDPLPLARSRPAGATPRSADIA